MLEQDTLNQVKCGGDMYIAAVDTNDTLYELRDHLMKFLLFLDTETTVQDFLAYDRCFIYADKYLLAIIFSYFTRAGFEPKHEYTQYTFFLALYLAQEMEEEDNDLIKDELYIWALGSNWKTHVKTFEKDKMELFINLGYKTTVSRAWCEELFDLIPGSPAWKRTRATAHSGARQKVARKVDGEYVWVHRIKGVCWKCADDSMVVGSYADTNFNSSSDTETSSPDRCSAAHL